MFQLPKDILTNIWEFDPTYRDTMNDCLIELQHVSPYWGLRVMYGNNYHRDANCKWNYKKFYNINKKLTKYWNYDYNKLGTIRDNAVADTDKPKHWTYNEFVCDVFPKMHKRIFRNIKNYKYTRNKYRGDNHTFYKS